MKTREVQNAIFDSARWNGFKFRDGDIIVVTWSKSGTTWTQQIIAQLILGAPEGVAASEVSPWVDFRIRPLAEVLAQLEAQTHRRCLKTHLAVDALPFSPTSKYIYVGRDARDIVWSWYNHHANLTAGALEAFNDLPDRVGPPIAHPACDIREYYLHWLRNDAFPGCPPFPSLWEHTQGWWDIRHLPNVLLVHFNGLKENMVREIRRIADFLEIPIPKGAWPAILEHCSFDYMRSAAAKNERLNAVFKDGGNTFFNKGTNGRWKDVLSQDEISWCDEAAARKLAPDCAHWLRTGQLPE